MEIENRQVYPHPGFDTPEPLDQVLEAALGTYEAFRRLGFLPKHLFIEYDNGWRPAIVRYCIRDGAHPEFRIDCGAVADIAEADFRSAWSAKVQWWKTMIEREDPACHRLMESWLAGVDGLALILALQAKGYEVGAARGAEA